ncbi:MAG: SGNH/GDSL hydrolase family protein [Ignavibacteria bacterium]
MKKKDSQTFRIFALGDSFIWGDGLKNKDLITIKIENLLNKKVSDNINIEVVNTGIGGFNTQDEYNQLLRLFPVYTPNLVIQFFFTNDILATSNQNRILDKKVIYHMWLRKNSKFYSFLYYLIKGTINAEITFPKFLLPQDYFDLDDTKSGWVNFKKYTLRIKKFCEKNNLGYCFVLISTLTNLDENYPYIEINKKVTEFITNIDVPFLSYFDLFSKYEPTELWVSQENTHWNGKATTLAAKETTNFLIKKELIPYENNYSQVFLQ